MAAITIEKASITLAALLALALAACGGDSGEGRGPGGVGGAAVVHGQVQSFEGGLRVNGVAFRTSGATYRNGSDDPVTLSSDATAHLAPGAIVTVRGTVDADGAAGTATEIRAHDLLVGTVEAAGAGWIQLEGVVVAVEDATAVAGAASPGAHVAVAGHADARGGIAATRIEARPSELEQEAKGWIASVEGAVLGIAFSPGGPVALRVDVSGIAGRPALAVGDLVEVKTRGPANGAGVFTAVRIHREDDLRHGHSGLWVEVEGIVTAVDASGFEVAGQRVVATASTALEHGTMEDLVAGVKVEVEGTLREDGALVARKISFRPSVRVEANAEAVDAAAGTIRLLGLDVHVTPSTELRGTGSVGAIQAGWNVEVRGIPTRDGTGLTATRLEVRDTRPSDRAILRGVVTEKSPTSGLTILGIALDTTRAEFRSHEDVPMSATAFFDAITVGKTVVKVRWRPYPASTADAVEEAELEHRSGSHTVGDDSGHHSDDDDSGHHDGGDDSGHH